MQKEENEDNEDIMLREAVQEDNEEVQNQSIEEDEEQNKESEQKEKSQARKPIKRKSEVDNGPNSKYLRNRTILISSCTHSDIVMMSKDFVDSTETPCTFNEAVKSHQKKEWINAMKEEINSLVKNKTWVLRNLPKGSKALPCKWVFKIKTNADGSVDKYKTRLVIKGFKQKYGVDYEQTFSPVAKMSTIRSLLSIAATENLHMMQFDVSTAFLYGELEETIYMNQPEGFNDGSNRVCLLNKSLYGLKQASRCWNTRIGKFLENIGFRATTADSCLYVREKNDKKVILALYVDDGIVTSSDKRELEILLRELQTEFKITIREAKYFLGLEIEETDKYIKIHQSAYAKKILERFNFLECRSISTPMEKLSMNNTKSEKVNKGFPYR